MPWFNALIGLVAVIGVGVMLYPTVASWVTQYYQSQIIDQVDDRIAQQPPSQRERELQRARDYNDALVGGSIVVAPDSNVPTASRAAGENDNYYDLLNATADGIMGRLRISAIGVDLPIYHGTDDLTLTKGVGHLHGTSLPVGGASQHAVLTAHRGYPSATLFNDLHRLRPGDTFTVEIFGEVATYRVIETHTVLPEETQAIAPRYGEDLMTLVTCTPLGVNTHRELVTGERLTPTPAEDVSRAGRRPEIPGFPWWVVAIAAVVVGYAGFVTVSGRAAARRQQQNRAGSGPA
ncbi:MAG: class C sortase [Propionibacterium sp.]|nr:class C sortase [Propionibacterium sp.]